MAPSRVSALPLPRGWPRRVRSAVVHAISLATASLTSAWGWAADSWNPRVRPKDENVSLRGEIALLREELRLKDARMARIPAQRRPNYPPAERLAILELRAARGWSLAQTADRLLVTPLTVSHWMQRLDEGGPSALVQIPVPVNRFPDLVGYLVRRLKTLCPTMGRVRIARVLARAGLHLGSTTVRRMLRAPGPSVPHRVPDPKTHRITARKPNDLWHLDRTTVPTALGFWASWVPLALPQGWPFCWWVGLVVDHSSRRVMGFEVSRRQPSAEDARRFLGRLIAAAGTRPRYLVTDRGSQFIARAFRRWCRRQGIRQRFGAIGQYGSLAIIERCIRSLKDECTRRLAVVPLRVADFENELALYVCWYNAHRPHGWLGAVTPDERYHRRRPAARSPRFEPRARWPRRSPCASPQTLIRGQPGALIEIDVRFLDERSHLPIVSLKRAA